MPRPRATALPCLRRNHAGLNVPLRQTAFPATPDLAKPGRSRALSPRSFHSASPISSSVGSRPSVCSSCRRTRKTLLIPSTMCTGTGIRRARSAITRVIACRIHQVASVENLKPPLVVELLNGTHQAEVALRIKSRKDMPRPMYFARHRHHQPQVRLGELHLGHGNPKSRAESNCWLICQHRLTLAAQREAVKLPPYM